MPKAATEQETHDPAKLHKEGMQALTDVMAKSAEIKDQRVQADVSMGLLEAIHKLGQLIGLVGPEEEEKAPRKPHKPGKRHKKNRRS